MPLQMDQYENSKTLNQLRNVIEDATFDYIYLEL